jgi:hypothetical protein
MKASRSAAWELGTLEEALRTTDRIPEKSRLSYDELTSGSYHMTCCPSTSYGLILDGHGYQQQVV